MQRMDTTPALSPAVWIPARLVRDGAVWVLDPEGGRARLRELVLGARAAGPGGEEHVRVLGGLELADKVIDRGRQDLTEGARVRVEEVWR